MEQSLHSYIVQDPKICHGQATFRGTRILVADVLEQIASGMDWAVISQEWRGRVTAEAIAEAVRLEREGVLSVSDITVELLCVNVLDENIIDSQVELLHSWHISCRQVGHSVGRQGMQDDEIIPLLHTLRRPTFFTRDQRFFLRDSPHRNFCIAVLAVRQNEAAEFVRRFLKHPEFNTETKRLDRVVLISHEGLRVRQRHVDHETQLSWPESSKR